MATSGSFSDRMSLFTYSKMEKKTVLSRYDLTDNELEGYKQDILNDKMLVVANSDRSLMMKLKIIMLHIKKWILLIMPQSLKGLKHNFISKL